MDSADNLDTGSLSSTTASLTNTCPPNYLVVPRLSNYSSEAFCVIKYEAKAYDGTSLYDIDGQGVTLGNYEPNSFYDHQPWVQIDRDEAIDECRNLNSEALDIDIDSDTGEDGTFDLITNDHWQSLARNIELEAANWKEGSIGGPLSGGTGSVNNQINHGHADNSPASSLAASLTDTDACVGTEQEVNATIDDSCSLVGWPEKRTHVFISFYCKPKTLNWMRSKRVIHSQATLSNLKLVNISPIKRL